MDVLIPEKLYFKIGEVSEITGVKPHVLRYWEAEFGTFRPSKSKNQQRTYRRKDIELVLLLKDLLYNQGFTIAGARKRLQERPAARKTSSEEREQKLEEIRQDLRRLRDSL
jgi:DNA-binding transcriptional MerR regulator